MRTKRFCSGDEINIEFRRAGDYQFTSIDVVALPIEKIRKGIASLHQAVMTDVQLGMNSISGEIELSAPAVVCIAMPMSPGWKAFVDGEEEQVLSVNTFYMGIEAEQGHHTIKMYYETPYLRLGLLLSCIGILIFAVICVNDRKINERI